MKFFGVIAILGIVSGTAGCGSTSDSGGGTKTVVTVIEKQPAPSNSGDDTSGGSSGGEDPGDVSDGGTGSGGGGGKITLPNEVGKQLQAAQDDLQAHGLYNLDDQDATGQGRFQVFDRDWK